MKCRKGVAVKRNTVLAVPNGHIHEVYIRSCDAQRIFFPDTGKRHPVVAAVEIIDSLVVLWVKDLVEIPLEM